jgi:lipoate-protein ligase B
LKACRNMLGSGRPVKKWHCIELLLTDYQEAWDLQRDLVAARNDKIIDTDIVLLLEHFSVFTLGRRGEMDNLLVSEEFLKKSKIPLIRVERGGDITFHGPGQLIVYPVVNLRTAGFKVVDFIKSLEKVMIQTSLNWGIPAERNPLNRGVWVGGNKLGSVGITVRRGVSFHGFALNVNLSLEPFTWIRPCGLQDVAVTSMEQEISQKVPMNQVRESVKCNIESVLGIELAMIPLSAVQTLLKK